MTSPILLGKPFHAIRFFILVSSACSLFLSQIPSGMTDIRKSYTNKQSRHLCPVCELEEEIMHHLVACNVNMPFEYFQKVCGNDSRDIELVPVAVRESVNTRNKFI